ncbi:WXG100 family type VII secretion target [uncultured Microbacterium sp.]|uniref:WXG100 family type VII secretion target n=1 Tax=uncultured Microbacterium sp. TaxID=191216 RepID=UPI0025E6ACE6|nr:WXG100 family type VII secretion target [uncultured Microbacterium sp.]
MQIKLDPAKHLSFLDEINASISAIDGELNRLDTSVKTLQSAWSGEARDAYRIAQSEWSRSMRELRAVLDHAREGAADAGRKLRAADDSVRGLWD